MKSVLKTLVLTPLRWALEEAWQTVVAVGLLVGALVVGSLGARSLWLGIVAGIALVVIVVALLVVVQRLAEGTTGEERDSGAAG